MLPFALSLLFVLSTLGPCCALPSSWRLLSRLGRTAPSGWELLPPSALSADEIEEVVDLHNELRRIPHASNMKKMRWSDELAAGAQLHVDQCVFEHGTFSWPGQTVHTVGQNMLFASAKFLPMDYAVESFYDEVDFYDIKNNTCTDVCGHYTQLVWAESDEVGCALKLCESLYYPDGKKYVNNAAFFTCDYSPAGNVYAARPYIEGAPCTRCSSKRGWCDDGLCSDCNPEDTDTCECKAECLNGGSVTSNCTCACAQGYIGIGCEKECSDLHVHCGTGWPRYTCDLPEARDMVRAFCPKMCGLCEPVAATTEPTTTTEKTTECSVQCGHHGHQDSTYCACNCHSDYYGDQCQHKCPTTCVDKYPQTCPEWTPFCEEPAYVSFMEEVCPMTCGYCSVPAECQKK